MTLGGQPLPGQSPPLGDQFQVNTTTTGHQSEPGVGVAADGRFVVVWNDRSQTAKFQRYAADGTPLGGETSSHSGSPFILRDPAVAVDADAEFVVAWGEYYNGMYRIRARKLAADGSGQTSDFTVAAGWEGYGDEPDADFAGNGSFVVVWEQYMGDVWGRRFTSAGSPAAAPFQVNTTTTGMQNHPEVAVDGDGDFVVTWWDQYANIRLQRFGSAGSPVGSEQLVSSGMVAHPSVDMADSGEFVVAWREYGSASDIGFFIYGRRYDASGNPVGGVFKVNTSGSGEDNPSVAVQDDGRFTVVWEGGEIRAREYAANGTPAGDQYTVNSYTSSTQNQPVVAGDGAGFFVTAWTSYGSPGGDLDQGSVQARLYGEALLFADDFESGGTGRWSLAVP